jgi:carbonic anhydrase
MNPIIEGVLQFQERVYPAQRELFERLAKRQEPKVLFLTCADSRIDPALVTQSPPGRLFVCRNIGNIVPPHGTPDGSVASVLEYAIGVVGIEHIIVCGHSDCGAMKGLLDPQVGRKLPAVAEWLRYADAARRTTTLQQEIEGGDELLRAITEQNILTQLNSLGTYPEVASALTARKLAVHGWYYDIGTGAVRAYDVNRDSFVPLDEWARSGRQA